MALQKSLFTLLVFSLTLNLSSIAQTNNGDEDKDISNRGRKRDQQAIAGGTYSITLDDHVYQSEVSNGKETSVITKDGGYLHYYLAFINWLFVQSLSINQS